MAYPRKKKAAPKSRDSFVDTSALDDLRAEAAEILERSQEAGSVADDDQERFDEIEAEVERINAALDSQERLRALVEAGAVEHTSPVRKTGGAQTRERAENPLKGAQVLRSGDSLEQWAVDNGRMEKREEKADLDRYLRGVLGGGWAGAEYERSLAENTSTAGGVMVPVQIAAGVLDMARSKSQLLNAGVSVVPMLSNKLTVPKIVTNPAPAARNENAAIVQNDITFTGVELVARSVARIVRVSRELVMDNPNTTGVVAKALSDSFADEIDRIGLFGSGVAPEPRGLLNYGAIPVTSHGANGGALTYDYLLAAAGAVRAANHEPTAHLLSSRGLTALGMTKDSTGAYLAAPQGLLPILPTNRIPNNVTVGTSNDTSYVFTGDFPNGLVMGVRESLELTWLTERFADTGELALVGHARLDFALLDETAFVIDKGVR
ncbi:phage major capsid protein [Rhodococcus sp. IEGM 1370]|uniref:phage major capsid protein n=1 Tax=Rhodococcus sp. IEGM 1370 TaxID=3082222 RepID=UPI002953620F|nr:phage major capsid protein [Rhodococcus sp. IEGM 1370]MDV8076289.1 phage major capsid protein [Rhodococcus sp. IEGM 1370]